MKKKERSLNNYKLKSFYLFYFYKEKSKLIFLISFLLFFGGGVVEFFPFN